MRLGILQLNVSDDPAANLSGTLDMVEQAARAGAVLIATPEVTNCVSTSRKRQIEMLRQQDDDPTLAALRQAANTHGVWLLIGSLALKTGDPDGRFANRSFLIDSKGQIAAWYDKIHMFDVTISDSEAYHESKGYRPGDRAVVTDTPFGKIGLTICYDMRFPALYRTLAQAGARIISAPSAFSPVTGDAHWESLLRARAIETGCFVIAPAQTGTHAAKSGKSRTTYGHSMVVSPWGQVLLDAGTKPGISVLDMDLEEVNKARQRVPSLEHDRPYTLD
ncbi:hypothetical protein C8N43_2449 [Litoreibacter ponti]|uniref:CN hydrolase domain-containing protein n=1 Tax=Litoreibacter ponti TaxID=1510457 RepID=A0A2T6BP63_9RHOB|nr:carbon-nitrogen hydrolase family protein [Litoreibacter ponti]PTX57777.1 hypothetical protein C8N43_2449 [Litoreibacter ponti]